MVSKTLSKKVIYKGRVISVIEIKPQITNPYFSYQLQWVDLGERVGVVTESKILEYLKRWENDQGQLKLLGNFTTIK